MKPSSITLRRRRSGGAARGHIPEAAFVSLSSTTSQAVSGCAASMGKPQALERRREKTERKSTVLVQQVAIIAWLLVESLNESETNLEGLVLQNPKPLFEILRRFFTRISTIDRGQAVEAHKTFSGDPEIGFSLGRQELEQQSA